MTGVWGDHRRDLQPDHSHYPAAWLAWRDQDHWTDAEHAESWRVLLQRWPMRNGTDPERDERAYIAWFLHRGHGVPLEELADQFGYTRDALYRMARDGAEHAPAPSAQPTRVPHVFAIDGREPSAKPRPPYRVTSSHVPHRLSWDHPRPMAFRWKDEHGHEQIVLPLNDQPWERLGPRRFRVQLMHTGTVYFLDGTTLKIDREFLERIKLAPGASFGIVTG